MRETKTNLNEVMMYQRLVIVGNLGRDPEMRYTPQGTAVTTLNVATSRKYKNSADVLKEETLWFRVSVWGKQAETVNQYLAKGSKVLVEGELTADESGNPRVWTDKEGKPRASFEMRAINVRFLSGNKSDTSATEPKEQTTDDFPE